MWDQGVGQSAGLKYCSPAGLQRERAQRSLPWSIAKCLPGICLFNPLSKATWACDVDEKPAAHRKSWQMEAGYMWTRHTHWQQSTTLLTCGNTCTNTTDENSGPSYCDLSTFYSESYSIQQQMQWQKKDSEHCRPWGKQSVNHKRSFILKRRRQKERERQRGRTERFVTAPGCPFNVTLTHRLPKLLLYLRVPFHSTMYTCMYICTCTVSKYNQHIQAISKSNSRYVTALRRCWVSEKWAAMSPVRAGEVWKQVTDRRFFSHKGHMRTFWLQAFFGVTH